MIEVSPWSNTAVEASTELFSSRRVQDRMCRLIERRGRRKLAGPKLSLNTSAQGSNCAQHRYQGSSSNVLAKARIIVSCMSFHLKMLDPLSVPSASTAIMKIR